MVDQPISLTYLLGQRPYCLRPFGAICLRGDYGHIEGTGNRPSGCQQP